MAISMYVRPDRVYGTGVIAPYPIRQMSPVTIAREAINPFSVGIRPQGPTVKPLSGPAARALLGGWALDFAGKARGYIKTKVAMVRQNSQPNFNFPARPAPGVGMRNQLVAQGRGGAVPTYAYDAARAWAAANRAAATGSTWDMVRTNQYQLRFR